MFSAAVSFFCVIFIRLTTRSTKTIHRLLFFDWISASCARLIFGEQCDAGRENVAKRGKRTKRLQTAIDTHVIRKYTREMAHTQTQPHRSHSCRKYVAYVTRAHIVCIHAQGTRASRHTQTHQQQQPKTHSQARYVGVSVAPRAEAHSAVEKRDANVRARARPDDIRPSAYDLSFVGRRCVQCAIYIDSSSRS